MGKFSRGYGESRAKVDKSPKFSRSCFNCISYYKTMEDEGEVCQNPNVTRYDMVSDGMRVYCTYWNPIKDSGSFFHRDMKAPLQKDVDRYFDSKERERRYNDHRAWKH